MKKEKERNLTLEQLEKKRNFLNRISLGSLVVVFIVTLTSVGISGIVDDDQRKIILPVYTIFFLALFGLLYFCLTLRDVYECRIDEIKKQKKVEKMRQLSKKGNLKDFVEIKSEKMKMDILSHGIDKEFSVKIQLKGDKEIFMITTLSKEKLLLLLQDEEKQEILDRLIDTVEVNKIIGADGNELSKLRISTYKCQYYQGGMTDSELLEMLEVKK